LFVTGTFFSCAELCITNKKLTKVYRGRIQAQRVRLVNLIARIPLARCHWIDEACKSRKSDHNYMAYSVRGTRAYVSDVFDRGVIQNLYASMGTCSPFSKLSFRFLIPFFLLLFPSQRSVGMIAFGKGLFVQNRSLIRNKRWHSVQRAAGISRRWGE